MKQTIIEHEEKIKVLNSNIEKHKLIYEWVKTRKICFKDYMKLSELIKSEEELLKETFEQLKNKQERMYNEESECVNMYLDDLSIQRQSEDGQEYSIVGRIKLLESRCRCRKLLFE